MRKILVLFGALTFVSLSAGAFLDEDKTANIDTLKIQGFSNSTLQIVDWARYRNQDANLKYVKYYKEKNNGKLGRIYQAIKIYTDPIQDDGKFGDHHIEFSNTWRGDEPSYASELVPSYQVDNL